VRSAEHDAPTEHQGSLEQLGPPDYERPRFEQQQPLLFVEVQGQEEEGHEEEGRALEPPASGDSRDAARPCAPHLFLG
jgi:hypothetical protein